MNNNFIEHSLQGAVSFLKEAGLGEEYAGRGGFLQSLDPRVKTTTLLLFVFTVVGLKSAVWIGALYFLCLALAFSSSLPLGFFLLRTWVFIPFFSLVSVIPALFNFVTPGEPVYEFFILGVKLIITRPGLNAAVLFVARIAASVSFVVLLSLTTRQAQLLKVLRLLGVSKVFVLTVAMCYRYLYLFAAMVENIFTAIKSRVGTAVRYRAGGGLAAWNMANMWNRACQINEDVYRAMLARGYTGEPRLLAGFQAGFRDWVWLSVSVLICAALIYLGH